MIKDIKKAIAPFHLLQHPFYQAWMRGDLTQEELKDYAGQYYSHVKAFPRYISATHSQCQDDSARRILLENLNDEEGITFGTSHPELWLRFAEGLGLTRSTVESTEPRTAIQQVQSTFLNFARSSAHEGLAALYTYEAQVPEVAESKIQGLKKNYHIHDSKTLEFFEVHKTADIYHREAIEKIIEDLPLNKKSEALNAARSSAKALWDFLSDVYQGNCHHELHA